MVTLFTLMAVSNENAAVGNTDNAVEGAALKGKDSADPAKAVEEKEELTPREELEALQLERRQLLTKVRKATDEAAAQRQRAINDNEEMRNLQSRVTKLQEELQEARKALSEKMREVGFGEPNRAPPAALEGMKRMREIDKRMRELMQQGAANPRGDNGGSMTAE